jgi:hypothetical protein
MSASLCVSSGKSRLFDKKTLLARTACGAVAAMAVVLGAGVETAAGELPATPHRVYSHLIEPREHPDYDRRAVKPPTWDTFKNRTQFTSLRGFNVENDRIVGYAEEIEKYTKTHQLGDVIWPAYPILFAKNLGDLADEIKRRDLYLFDVWGYVPGSGPGGYWQQFMPPPEAFAVLTAKLGERWLGVDNGEQDGRYIGGYANQMTPASSGRVEQYYNFQRHFERLGDDLGHRHATLVSLNYGHYFLKEGTYTLVGAETAQALPNNQIYYAFIRGAGKQYGVPWFGNASIYNRWGFKTYGGPGDGDHGPTKGASLSLMKRLLYSHILYNSVATGFENGWFDGNALSPIGRIQQSAQRWVKEHGQPGVMHAPVALLLDFHAGWTFPRHLYSENVYRVWGNLPYAPGDYLTDAVLDMLYPGYQNSSYFHDESGFIAPTPYGDIADCLLSDAQGWLLDRYAVVVVAGELTGGTEIRNKLQQYMEHGGHVVITAGNLAKMPGGLARQTAAVATVATVPCGKGKLTLLASGFGVDVQEKPAAPLKNETDRPLAKPYALRPELRQTLDAIFRQQMLFEVGGQQLSCITCRRAQGQYLLGIANNSWRELPLKIVSLCGPIESINELPLDVSERQAVGFLPEGVDGRALGRNTAATIAGGDVRVFAVRVKETGVEEIPHVAPPPRPRGRVLPLRQITSIKESILARPTFFEHFDGVMVDWRYLHQRESSALQAESKWIGRQGLRVYVDLSSGIDLYPTLRLIDNLHADYEASMAAITNVIAKMKLLGSHDLILSLHRHPENNYDGAQTQAGFEKTLKTLAAEAAQHGVTLHVRMAFGKPGSTLEELSVLLDKAGAKNVRIAGSTALLAATAKTPVATKIVQDKLGLWFAAATQHDVAGALWNAHAPLARSADVRSLSPWLLTKPDAPIVFDAVLDQPAEETQEAAALESILKPAAGNSPGTGK